MGGKSSNIVCEYESPQGAPPTKNVAMLHYVENHLSCGVCHYPCNETVVTSCGHKFCKLCLENEKDMREYGTLMPQKCPTCTKDITSTIRLYDDDRMIGSILDNFASDLTGLYASVRRKMDDAVLKAKNRKLAMDREINFVIGVICSILLFGIFAVFCCVMVFRDAEYSKDGPGHFNGSVAPYRSVVLSIFEQVERIVIGKNQTGGGLDHCMSTGRGFDFPQPQ